MLRITKVVPLGTLEGKGRADEDVGVYGDADIPLALLDVHQIVPEERHPKRHSVSSTTVCDLKIYGQPRQYRAYCREKAWPGPIQRTGN